MTLFARTCIVIIVALLCCFLGMQIGLAIGDELYPENHFKGINHDFERNAVSAIAVKCGIGSAAAGAAISSLILFASRKVFQRQRKN